MNKERKKWLESLSKEIGVSVDKIERVINMYIEKEKLPSMIRRILHLTNLEYDQIIFSYDKMIDADVYDSTPIYEPVPHGKNELHNAINKQ